MKTRLMFLLPVFFPIFLFSQNDDLYYKKDQKKGETLTTEEKITCSSLIKDHLDGCEKCSKGDKCHTRADLLKFCSNQEQELVVLDEGPENCNCPTYGHYYAINQPGWGNWYNYTPYYDDANYYYTGPTFSYKSGIVFGASWNLGNHYFPARWRYGRGSYYARGGYNDWGGYYRNGNYYTRGNYNGWGNYHNNGNYQNHGSHNQSGSYYGSRKTQRRR